MEIDEDILVIQDNRPRDPADDPLEVNQYNALSQQETNFLDHNEQGGKSDTLVINLDSSDDEGNEIIPKSQKTVSEVNKNAQITIKNFVKEKKSDGTILRTCLQPVPHQPSLDNDVIDLDADDSDPLAPLKALTQSLAHTSDSRKSAGLKIACGSVKNTADARAGVSLDVKQDLKDNKRCTKAKIIKHNIGGKDTVKTTEKVITCTNTTKNKIIRLSNSRVKLANKPSDISSIKNREETIQPHADVPENKNLQYVGKIIRIPGQPSLIENSSGLVFRADNNSSGLNNAGQENGLESEINLYRNFFKTPHRDLPNPSHSLLVNDVFVQNKESSHTDEVSIIEPEVDKLENRFVLSKNKDVQPRNQLMGSISSNSKRAQPQIISYQPQEANNTVLDLNLNINDRLSTANSLNTTSPSQTIAVPSDPTGRYNVALGLVLNVNETNQSNNNFNLRDPQRQYTSLNNVAVDVSFNVNNKEKPTTVTSEQELQHSAEEPDVYRNILNDANNAGRIYCCGFCLLRTADIGLIKSHACPGSPSLNAEASVNDLMQISTNKNISSLEKPSTTLSYNKMGRVYYCNTCLFKTYDINLIEKHGCMLNTSESNVESYSQKHSNSKDRIDSSIIKQMYRCVSCLFTSANFETMASHDCQFVNGNETYRNFNNSNLECTQTSAPKPLTATQDQERNMQNVYRCVGCSFQSIMLDAMNCHKCPSVNSESLTETETVPLNKSSVTYQADAPDQLEENGLPAKLYCCMSCSFKTAVFKLAQSHRCREVNLKGIMEDVNVPPLAAYESNTRMLAMAPDMQKKDNSPNSVNMCDVCSKVFKTKHGLFRHVRGTHFSIRKLLGCKICPLYFKDGKELSSHLQMKHSIRHTQGVDITSTCKSLYECSFCHFQSECLHAMKLHFDHHIEENPCIMKTTWKHSQPVVKKLPANELSQACILCGNETDLPSWLSHNCRRKVRRTGTPRQKYVCDKFPIRPETAERTYKRRWISSLIAICIHCRKEIVGDALKCDNRECQNWYHIKCVEICSVWLRPEHINISNWFCVECKQDSVPLQDDVDNISMCLDFAEKEYFREVKKRKSMINELNIIKDEKAKMKEEFERIQNFIMESKSDRINNDVVRSVCTVLESFINASIK